jgi:hypothetical protein
MIKTDGIILVISCQKFLNTRLKELNLKDDYGNWKVIYVIGDLFLNCDYKLEGNFMTIKCEDSYLHLFKKIVLSLKYLYEIFDIKEGVLRSNDDLVFNETRLNAFLVSPKYKIKINGKNELNCIETDIDFLGSSPKGLSVINEQYKYEPSKSETTLHLDYYYKDHPEEFDNPLHNLKGVDILKYSKMPYTPVFLKGPLIYFSNKSCKILIEHMESINYDIYHYDEKSNSYPYTIDDLAYPLILLPNNINLIHCDYWHKDLEGSYGTTNNSRYLAIHTNKYK